MTAYEEFLVNQTIKQEINKVKQELATEAVTHE